MKKAAPVILLALLAAVLPPACRRGADAPPLNQPPAILLSAQPDLVPPGGRFRVTATFSDPNQDDLTLTWIAPSGHFLVSGQARTWHTQTASFLVQTSVFTWVAPAAAGTYTVRVLAADTDFSLTEASLRLAVGTGGTAVVPPGSKPKLGPHGLVPANEILDLVRAGAPVAKLVVDLGMASSIKSANPDVVLIGRLMQDPDYGAAITAGLSPASVATQYVNAVWNTISRFPSVDYWEGINEPILRTANAVAWYRDFEIARMRIMQARGERCCIGNFSVANPDEALWPHFAGALRSASTYQAILGMHEYAATYMWWRQGWYTLRYRRLYQNVGLPNAYGPPLVITECGLDVLTDRPSGAPQGAWKLQIPYWTSHPNPAGAPIPWQAEPERYYADQLIWYDRELQKDSYVLGATIFTVGCHPGTWDNYNVQGKVSQYLTTYISASQ